MAAAFHVKTKTQWKKVDIESAGFSQKDLDSIISLEEVTDYEIIGKKDDRDNAEEDTQNRTLLKNDKKQKKNKRKVAQEVHVIVGTDKEKDVEGKKKRKKGKEKKKKQSTDKEMLKGEGQVIEDMNELMEAEGNKQLEQEGKKKLGKEIKKRKHEDRSIQESKSNKKMKLENVDEPVKHKKALKEETLSGMDAWQDLFVPSDILLALHDQGFQEPTPIQSQILPSAIRDKMDIVGAAETGSGKTLAFGIPVLHFILQQKKIETERQQKVPFSSDENGSTDEEEDQDEDDDSDNDAADDSIEHMAEEDVEESDDDDADHDENENVDNPAGNVEEGSSSEEEDISLDPDGIGCVKVIKDVDFSWLEEETVVKSQATHPRALILEPTRELAIQVKNHLQAAAKYTDVKVAAIVGGLAMPKQQRILKKCPDILVATPGRLWELIQQGEVYLSEIEKTNHLVVDEADRMIEKGHFEELSKLLERMKRDPGRENRHTYVFSATLTLIHSGPQRLLKKKKKKMGEKQKLVYLMRKMGLKPKPKVVDLTRKVGTVETLTEARINCTKEEKDIYLYYFIKHYPGRTLIFTNSKDCIRRLVSIFTLLQCNPLPLHADMHQRQRLKNLDKFTGNKNAILIASDVAARGLDIPNVQHVIHYQVPHTVENYVHRSGRTARARKEGLSVMITGPEDVKNYRKIIHTLNKNEELPLFPIEQQSLSEIRRRVNMVRQIETKEYRFKKSKRQNDWFKKAADEIGVDIEDEGLLDDLGDDTEQMRHQQYIKRMKAELALLLKQPLQTGLAQTKYPTMSGKLLTPPTDEAKGDALTHVKKTKKTHDELLKTSDESRISQKSKNKRKFKWRKKKKNKNMEDST